MENFTYKVNDITGKTHLVLNEYVMYAIAILVLIICIVWLMKKMTTSSFSNYPLNSTPARFVRSDRFTVQKGEAPEFTSVGSELIKYNAANANAADPSIVTGSESFTNSKIAEKDLAAIGMGM